MTDPHDLQTAIRKTVKSYVDDTDLVDELVYNLMELIDPTIHDARRAAAQEMQDRCVAILDRALGSAHLDGYTYTLLHHRIRGLPLGSEKEE